MDSKACLDLMVTIFFLKDYFKKKEICYKFAKTYN